MMWNEIQDALGVEIPTYLRNLLNISGYDNKLSLREMTDKDVNDVEEFARRSVSDLISAVDMEAYFGVYKNKPQNFVILPGHRKIIDAITNYLRQPVSADETHPRPSHQSFRDCAQSTSISADVIRDPDPTAISPSIILPSVEIPHTVMPCFRDDQNKAFDFNKDGVVLRANLAKWLYANRQFMRDRVNICDLEICISADISHAGKMYNLSVAIVKCKKCRSKVKLIMTSPGRHWVTSNFHRHVRRAHFRRVQLPVEQPIFSTHVESSTCALEFEPSTIGLTEVPETPCYNPILKVEIASTSEIEQHSNVESRHY